MQKIRLNLTGKCPKLRHTSIKQRYPFLDHGQHEQRQHNLHHAAAPHTRPRRRQEARRTETIKKV